MLIMWGTLFLYLFGPIRWVDKWDIWEVIIIALLAGYFLAFAFGYLLRSSISQDQPEQFRDIARSEGWKRFLNIAIYVNFALVVGNALLYTEAASVSDLLNKAVQGILNPAEVYYSKNASSRAGSLLVWITMLASPFTYITNVLSVYAFKSLSKVGKVCVVATFVIEVGRWLAVGTNKGLFDVVLLFLTLYLIVQMRFYGQGGEKSKSEKKKIRRIQAVVIAAMILFFMFFGKAISDRVGGVYTEENYASFPYNLVPEGLRFLVDKMDSYLIQGYNNYQRIIENCEFKWTFGAGNSRFFMQAIELATDVDLTPRTYPYQLEAFGVDPLVSWHSAYGWLASDVTPFGIIFVMFILGFYMCGVTMDVIRDADPVSMALFYLLIMTLANASCTNYVLAYTNGFVGFWALVVIRWLRKKGVGFWI